MKEEQKQHLIDMMKEDERLGLYDETEHLLSTEANKEMLLEDVFNDEKRRGVRDLIDAHKQYFYCSDRLELDENERCVTQCEHCAVIQPKYTIGCDPYDKQETLEEASWKFNPLKKLDGEFLRHAFKEGAKWQQERMYNKEKVDKLLDTLIQKNMCSVAGDELIEQFKNK